VRNATTGVEMEAEPLTEVVFEILESGGIKPLVKRQLAALHAQSR
jgi:hypothetical protein